MKNVKKYQEGDLIIPPQNYFKDYFTSYYMIKDKNYFFKDWLNKRKDILDKNIHKFSQQYPDMVDDVQTELQNQLSNVNSVKEYARDNNIDFLPNYTKSPRLEYYIDDFQYLNHSNGLYVPGIHQILYNDAYPDIIIHERTHSLNPRSQEYAIGQLNIKTKNDYSESDYHKSINIDNSYFDNPKEIYARLMQFRHANKLDPNKTYTIEDVKKFKEDPYIQDFNLLDRYSEEDVLKLLNEIAYNNTNESINMAKKGCKLIPKRKVKKCQAGEIVGNQPISYGTWKTWQEMQPEHQKSLENLAMQQYADNKAKYGDDVPEEAKYLYSMGLLPEVEVTASNNLNKRQQMQADQEWSNYLDTHPIQIGSEEYNRLPEKAKAQVYKNGVTDAIDNAALPTAAAIIAPTALTAGAAAFAGSSIAPTMLNAANKSLNAYGMATSPQTIKDGISQLSNKNYISGAYNIATGIADMIGLGKAAKFVTGGNKIRRNVDYFADTLGNAGSETASYILNENPI